MPPRCGIVSLEHFRDVSAGVKTDFADRPDGSWICYREVSRRSPRIRPSSPRFGLVNLAEVKACYAHNGRLRRLLGANMDKKVTLRGRGRAVAIAALVAIAASASAGSAAAT